MYEAEQADDVHEARRVSDLMQPHDRQVAPGIQQA